VRSWSLPRQCTARGGVSSSHGPPLAFASCNPPAYLPGTQARIGPQSTGAVDITVLPGDTDPTNGDQADVTAVGLITDVQNASGGSDYNPQPGADLLMTERWRLSDTFNTTSAAPCSPFTDCSATLIDVEFPVPVQCTPTADPALGSNCNISTSFDITVPNVVKENESSV
jgi:hypothetical protein